MGATTGSPANPLGATVLWDGECPRIFTATALETISGGAFVQISGTAAAGTIGSQPASFATSDLLAVYATTVHHVNGIALQNTGSNELVPIATRGAFIVEADGVVSGGQAVIASTPNSVVGVGLDETGSIVPIGRAIVAAGSEQFTIVNIGGTL